MTLQAVIFNLDGILIATPTQLPTGFFRLILELKKANIRIGVVSVCENARMLLRTARVEPFIDAVIDGNLLRRPKPAPDAYLQVAKRMKVDPQNCVVVEDSKIGVQAADSANMCVIGIGQPQCVGQAQAVFPDFSLLRLENLLAVYKWWEASQPVNDHRPQPLSA